MQTPSCRTDLVGQRLVILQAVRLITDEQITDIVPSKPLLVQSECLIRQDEDLHRGPRSCHASWRVARAFACILSISNQT